MRDEMRPFLEEGVRQYVDAKNTVATFEREMGQLLAEAIRSRRQWSPLNDTPRIGRPSPGGGSGGYGYWIWIGINGQTKTYKRVYIECGLWWEVPTTTELKIDGPIIYANYDDMPKHIMAFSWRRNTRDIRSFLRGGKTFLYVPLRKPQEIAGSLNRLLDALLKQLR